MFKNFNSQWGNSSAKKAGFENSTAYNFADGPSIRWAIRGVHVIDDNRKIKLNDGMVIIVCETSTSYSKYLGQAEEILTS